MTTVGYIVKFETNLEGFSKKKGKTYKYGMLTWITLEGDERKDMIFPSGDTEKDYNLLKEVKVTSKISVELEQGDGKFLKLVPGTVKYLKKGDDTIPVKKKEKPANNYQKKPFDNTEKEKRVTFVWAIHNASEMSKLVFERSSKEISIENIAKVRKRLLMEAYKFKTPEIGRSFIGVAISLYKEESLDDLNAVINRAHALYDEYVVVSKDLVSTKAEEPVPEEAAEPIPEEEQNNNSNISPEGDGDDLPF